MTSPIYNVPGLWPDTPPTCTEEGQKIPWPLQGLRHWPTSPDSNFKMSQWYDGENGAFSSLTTAQSESLSVCMVVHLFWKQWAWLQEQTAGASVQWHIKHPPEVDEFGEPVYPYELVSIYTRADGACEKMDNWGLQETGMASAFFEMHAPQSGLMRAMCQDKHAELAEVVSAFLGPGYAQWWRVQCLDQALSEKPAAQPRLRM